MRIRKLDIIGKNCKAWRVAHGYRQVDVANGTGYALVTISGFEKGRTDNYQILLWYILHGMPTSEVMKGVKDYDET